MLLKAQGDLFDFDHQAYAQGVSNQGVMGKGIAVEFRKKYPKMFSEYEKLCENENLKPGDVFFYKSSKRGLLLPDVFNLVTQGNLLKAEKKYLAESVKKMYVLSKEKGITDIAMPEIGCGLGNLNFSDLESALQPFINDSHSNVTIYSFTPQDI